MNCTENYNSYHILSVYFVQAQHGTIYINNFIFYRNSRNRYCSILYIEETDAKRS